MKRWLLGFVVFALMLCGCGSNGNLNDNEGDAGTNQNEVNNKDDEVVNNDQETDITYVEESFANEYYDNFKEVKNIVYYLKMSKDDVKVLKQTNDSITFCLKHDIEIDVHDESLLSYVNYVKMLEDEGYTQTQLDGTISSTFELTKENTVINVTAVSDVEAWKEIHKDLYNIDSMVDENLVCEVKVTK